MARLTHRQLCAGMYVAGQVEPIPDIAAEMKLAFLAGWDARARGRRNKRLPRKPKGQTK